MADIVLDGVENNQPSLPPGWEEVKSIKDDKMYYWNTKTGATTWKFPKEEAEAHAKMVRRHTYENISKSPSLSGEPAPPRSTSTSGEPAPPHSTSTSGEPAPPHSTSTSGEPAPPRSTSISGEPAPPRSTSTSGLPAPLRSASTSGLPAPLHSASTRGEPAPPAPPCSSSTSDDLGPSLRGDNISVLSRPSLQTLSPNKINIGGTKVTPSGKRGYENVFWAQSTSNEPHGGHVTSSSEPHGGHVTSSSTSSEPLSPSPPLPERRYLEQDLLTSPAPSHLTADGNATPTCNDGLNGESPRHELSEMGKEYAVIDRSHHGENRGVTKEAWSSEPPPTRPLRAYQRMNSREDLVSGEGSEEGCVVSESSLGEGKGRISLDPRGQSSSNYAVLDMTSDDTPSPSNETSIAYSIVELDSIKGGGGGDDETIPLPSSPHPYEVASPTSLKKVNKMADDDRPMTASLVDPHYEEIQEDDPQISGDGYMKVDHTRLRGYSAPVTPTTPTATPTFLEERSYDLPSNSRRLQSMNVTLSRGQTHTADYARLDNMSSREAILLRSGVTLRRNLRPESVSSYLSQQEGGGAISDDEEPIDKCIKSLESSLVGGSDSPEVEEQFKMIRPSYDSSHTRPRPPHLYEKIMGASQEDLDWDESDMGGGGAASCGLIKVPMDDLPKREQRVRVVHHQYEDMEIGSGTTDVPQHPISTELEGELPKGWEKLRDDQQKEYYWHIPTGKTQYAPPTAPNKMGADLKGQLSESPQTDISSPMQTSPAIFLGSLPISEDKLVTGQCVKAVHSCISKMAASLNKKDQNKGDAVFLQVKGLELLWLHPHTLAPITVQPINRIRVWGIGLDNERDFGYVSRDTVTRHHQCHIFRCGVPARIIAHRLLQSHQKERKTKQKSTTTTTTTTLHSVSTPALHVKMLSSVPPHKDSATSSSIHTTRVPDVGNSPHKDVLESSTTTTHQQASVHQSSNGARHPGGHECYDRIECVYIGCCDVNQGQGMDVINNAVEKLSKDRSEWINVILDVAISNITVCDVKSGHILKEHRVRYLCFLGIGKDDRFCGYILDNGDKGGGVPSYKFHGYYMSPNTDQLCLALHSACQARYKRIMDINRHPTQQQSTSGDDRTQRKSSSSSLLERFGSGRRKTPRAVEEKEGKNFIVEYMGYQHVNKVDGLDTVKPVVQELAVPHGGRPPYMVKFEVSPSGLSISDPQNKAWGKKEFPVKNITYVVKIRNYFAFVTREKSKYICHVFLEFKVDSGTIVTTIQRMLVPGSRE